VGGVESFFGNFSVAKSLGYKIIRNNQIPKQPALFEFNYETKLTLQHRRQEQDLWNIVWSVEIKSN
jgi:hypothetical protein